MMVRVKALLLLPSGLADGPVVALDGRTPLAAARAPGLDRVAREGRLGTVTPIPNRPRAGTARALAALLGLDPARDPVSRGGLEAAGLGVPLGPDDLAFRVNFVASFQEHLVDIQAGRLSSVEARLLVESLVEAFEDEDVELHAGPGYRHLLVLRGARGLAVKTTPPALLAGYPLADGLPRGPDAPRVQALMDRAHAVLAAHDVNRVRVDLGENPAEHMWLWGQGGPADIEPFELRTGLSLGVVAAVPVVRGLAHVLEAECPQVPGATGGCHTDASAKLAVALELLERHDVVALHVNAPAEASAAADPRLKVSVLEELDRRLVGPLVAELRRRGDTRLLVTTDHAAPVLPGERPPRGGLPFALWGPDIDAVRDQPFSEEAAAQAGLEVDRGWLLLDYVLGRERAPTGWQVGAS